MHKQSRFCKLSVRLQSEAIVYHQHNYINYNVLLNIFFFFTHCLLLANYILPPFEAFSRKPLFPLKGTRKKFVQIYNNVHVEIIYFKTNLERIAFQAMEDWKKTQKSPCDTKEKNFSFATTFPLNQGNHQRLELATNSVLDLSTLQTLIVRCS